MHLQCMILQSLYSDMLQHYNDIFKGVFTKLKINGSKVDCIYKLLCRNMSEASDCNIMHKGHSVAILKTLNQNAQST